MYEAHFTLPGRSERTVHEARGGLVQTMNDFTEFQRRNRSFEVSVTHESLGDLGRVEYAPDPAAPQWLAFVPDGCEGIPVWCVTPDDAIGHLEGKAEDRARAYARRVYRHSV